jgi:hypothetical protein
MRAGCEVAVSPVLIHFKLLYWTDALMYPWIENTQDGLVRQIHVRDSVTNVRWVAWKLFVSGAGLFRYFRPTEEQSSRFDRCRFRFVEKAIVEYMQW